VWIFRLINNLIHRIRVWSSVLCHECFENIIHRCLWLLKKKCEMAKVNFQCGLVFDRNIHLRHVWQGVSHANWKVSHNKWWREWFQLTRLHHTFVLIMIFTLLWWQVNECAHSLNCSAVKYAKTTQEVCWYLFTHYSLVQRRCLQYNHSRYTPSAGTISFRSKWYSRIIGWSEAGT
jgi:hypothetical protein